MEDPLMKITLDPNLTGAPQYVSCNAIGRGVWINLLLWCAEQENSGVIAGAASWSDEAWGMLGVDKETLRYASSLLSFTEADVFVWGYPRNQEDAIKAKRAGGKKGGLARVNNSSFPSIASSSSSIARSASSIPSTAYEPEIPENLKTDAFMQTWNEWLAYRRMRKLAAYKPQSLDKQLAELSDWGHDEAIRSINDSIRQQWQGLFPPKNSSAGGRKASFA